MLTKEQKERIKDYFDPWELVELLRLPMDDVLETFEEEIEDALDDLEDIMGVRNVRSN